MLDDVTTTEAFVKENDYTLSIVRKGAGYENSTNFNTRLTRTFNFAAQQVTTFTRDITFQQQHHSYGSSSSVATTTTIQNFSDFQSDLELRMMHKKLVELGGRPPAAEEIFADNSKKAQRLPAPKVAANG